jgi:hypothetical protein
MRTARQRLDDEQDGIYWTQIIEGIVSKPSSAAGLSSLLDEASFTAMVSRLLEHKELSVAVELLSKYPRPSRLVLDRVVDGLLSSDSQGLEDSWSVQLDLATKFLESCTRCDIGIDPLHLTKHLLLIPPISESNISEVSRCIELIEEAGFVKWEEQISLLQRPEALSRVIFALAHLGRVASVRRLLNAVPGTSIALLPWPCIQAVLQALVDAEQMPMVPSLLRNLSPQSLALLSENDVQSMFAACSRCKDGSTAVSLLGLLRSHPTLEVQRSLLASQTICCISPMNTELLREAMDAIGSLPDALSPEARGVILANQYLQRPAEAKYLLQEGLKYGKNHESPANVIVYAGSMVHKRSALLLMSILISTHTSWLTCWGSFDHSKMFELIVIFAFRS